MEALAAGVPVIASRAGGIPEVIDERKTGLLVPPGDPRALAEALDLLIKEPLFAQRLGQAGQHAARARFDITAMARANESLYAELLTVPD
jgi:starch synthase